MNVVLFSNSLQLLLLKIYCSDSTCCHLFTVQFVYLFTTSLLHSFILLQMLLQAFDSMTPSLLQLLRGKDEMCPHPMGRDKVCHLSLYLRAWCIVDLQELFLKNSPLPAFCCTNK